jgi:hypothetical protein
LCRPAWAIVRRWKSSEGVDRSDLERTARCEP